MTLLFIRKANIPPTRVTPAANQAGNASPAPAAKTQPAKVGRPKADGPDLSNAQWVSKKDYPDGPPAGMISETDQGYYIPKGAATQQQPVEDDDGEEVTDDEVSDVEPPSPPNATPHDPQDATDPLKNDDGSARGTEPLDADPFGIQEEIAGQKQLGAKTLAPEQFTPDTFGIKDELAGQQQDGSKTLVPDQFAADADTRQTQILQTIAQQTGATPSIKEVRSIPLAERDSAGTGGSSKPVSKKKDGAGIPSAKDDASKHQEARRGKEFKLPEKKKKNSDSAKTAVTKPIPKDGGVDPYATTEVGSFADMGTPIGAKRGDVPKTVIPDDEPVQEATAADDKAKADKKVAQNADQEAKRQEKVAELRKKNADYPDEENTGNLRAINAFMRYQGAQAKGKKGKEAFNLAAQDIDEALSEHPVARAHFRKEMERLFFDNEPSATAADLPWAEPANNNKPASTKPATKTQSSQSSTQTKIPDDEPDQEAQAAAKKEANKKVVQEKAAKADSSRKKIATSDINSAKKDQEHALKTSEEAKKAKEAHSKKAAALKADNNKLTSKHKVLQSKLAANEKKVKSLKDKKKANPELDISPQLDKLAQEKSKHSADLKRITQKATDNHFALKESEKKVKDADQAHKEAAKKAKDTEGISKHELPETADQKLAHQQHVSSAKKKLANVEAHLENEPDNKDLWTLRDIYAEQADIEHMPGSDDIKAVKRADSFAKEKGADKHPDGDISGKTGSKKDKVDTERKTKTDAASKKKLPESPADKLAHKEHTEKAKKQLDNIEAHLAQDPDNEELQNLREIFKEQASIEHIPGSSDKSALNRGASFSKTRGVDKHPDEIKAEKDAADQKEAEKQAKTEATAKKQEETAQKKQTALEEKAKQKAEADALKQRKKDNPDEKRSKASSGRSSNAMSSYNSGGSVGSRIGALGTKGGATQAISLAAEVPKGAVSAGHHLLARKKEEKKEEKPEVDPKDDPLKKDDPDQKKAVTKSMKLYIKKAIGQTPNASINSSDKSPEENEEDHESSYKKRTVGVMGGDASEDTKGSGRKMNEPHKSVKKGEK